MIIDWPIHVMAPDDYGIAFDFLNTPDQEATNGMSRATGQMGAKARVNLINIPVYDRASMRTFKALIARLEGRRNLCRFILPETYGTLDGPFAEETHALRLQYSKGIPFSTGAFFSTGVGFAYPYKKGSITAAATLNSKTIYVNNAPSGLTGCFISIEEFCYTVTGKSLHSGTVSKVAISPGLRRAIVAGTQINYAPVFVGSLVTDIPGYEAIRQGILGQHTLEFVEDLTRSRQPYSQS